MTPPDMAGWNLALRFGLEMTALVALGLAGWALGTGGMRWLLAVGLPVLAVVAWGTFNVVGDPSRSGDAPVEVGGWLRLAVEMLVLVGGVAALWYVGQPLLAGGVIVLIVIQYTTELDRARWLVEQ